MARERTTTEWNEKATATNATATATHAAESGNIHYVTAFTASLSGSGNTATFTLSDGSTTIMTIDIENHVAVALPYPIKLTAGNKAEAALTAGGTGIDGEVFIGGFTRGDD